MITKLALVTLLVVPQFACASQKAAKMVPVSNRVLLSFLPVQTEARDEVLGIRVWKIQVKLPTYIKSQISFDIGTVSVRNYGKFIPAPSLSGMLAVKKSEYPKNGVIILDIAAMPQKMNDEEDILKIAYVRKDYKTMEGNSILLFSHTGAAKNVLIGREIADFAYGAISLYGPDKPSASVYLLSGYELQYAKGDLYVPVNTESLVLRAKYE